MGKEQFFFFRNPLDVVISILPFLLFFGLLVLVDSQKYSELQPYQKKLMPLIVNGTLGTVAVGILFSIIQLFLGNRQRLFGAFFAIPFKLLICLIPALFLLLAAGGIINIIQNTKPTVSGGDLCQAGLLGPLGLFLIYLFWKRSKSKFHGVLTNMQLLLMICSACLLTGIINAKRECNNASLK